MMEAGLRYKLVPSAGVRGVQNQEFFRWDLREKGVGEVLGLIFDISPSVLCKVGQTRVNELFTNDGQGSWIIRLTIDR